MSYRLKLYGFEEASPQQVQAAEQRFRRALEAALGDESLVLPVYTAYRRLVATYGEAPGERGEMFRLIQTTTGKKIEKTAQDQ